jgi:hypothetical protein
MWVKNLAEKLGQLQEQIGQVTSPTCPDFGKSFMSHPDTLKKAAMNKGQMASLLQTFLNLEQLVTETEGAANKLRQMAELAEAGPSRAGKPNKGK